jgi:hypothetical protein
MKAPTAKPQPQPVRVKPSWVPGFRQCVGCKAVQRVAAAIFRRAGGK